MGNSIQIGRFFKARKISIKYEKSNYLYAKSYSGERGLISGRNPALIKSRGNKRKNGI